MRDEATPGGDAQEAKSERHVVEERFPSAFGALLEEAGQLPSVLLAGKVLGFDLELAGSRRILKGWNLVVHLCVRWKLYFFWGVLKNIRAKFLQQ